MNTQNFNAVNLRFGFTPKPDTASNGSTEILKTTVLSSAADDVLAPSKAIMVSSAQEFREMLGYPGSPKDQIDNKIEESVSNAQGILTAHFSNEMDVQKPNAAAVALALKQLNQHYLNGQTTLTEAQENAINKEYYPRAVALYSFDDGLSVQAPLKVDGHGSLVTTIINTPRLNIQAKGALHLMSDCHIITDSLELDSDSGKSIVATQPDYKSPALNGQDGTQPPQSSKAAIPNRLMGIKVKNGAFIFDIDHGTPAGPGANGNPGQEGFAGLQGKSMCSVTISILKQFKGTINIEAGGGNGQQGGIGGNGSLGGLGGAGAPGIGMDGVNVSAMPQGPQGAGGQGGMGGNGGNGGDPGLITIKIPFKMEQPNVILKPLNGNPGKNGSPGIGGAPGGASGMINTHVGAVSLAPKVVFDRLPPQ